MVYVRCEVLTPKLESNLKTGEVLALGAVGLIAAVYFSKVRAATTLIVLPGHVSNIYFDGATPVIELSLIVQNASSSGFVIESMAGQLTCDDYLIGNWSNFTPVHVNANSQVLVPVTVRLMLVGLVNNIINAFSTGQYEKTVVMKGFINAGFLRAPVNAKFVVGSPLNSK